MSVLGLFSAIAGLVKVRFLDDKEIIDNFVFRLHYRVTTAILFVECILCTANSLIGNPIDCITDGAFKDREHVINTYCWVTSTFTLPHQQNKPVGTHVIAPGVGTYVASEHNTHYHSYYQWVPFVLFLQGVLFYLPHWMWKKWEDGTVKNISAGMRGYGCIMDSKKQRLDRYRMIAQYIKDSQYMHNAYAFCYFLCEFLNFANVVGNIFFIDKFLGHTFLKYGTEVLKFSQTMQEERTDPMIAIFPRVTKCVFNKFGPSGNIQNHDALCILPLNILNEKIFIFMWFWFIFLATITGVNLLYSFAIILSSTVRNIKLKYQDKIPGDVRTLVKNLKIGDFLLVLLLGRNMSGMIFCEFLEELYSTYKYGNIPIKSKPSESEMIPMYPKIDKLTENTDP